MWQHEENRRKKDTEKALQLKFKGKRFWNGRLEYDHYLAIYTFEICNSSFNLKMTRIRR
jgi:hypothetical protein